MRSKLLAIGRALDRTAKVYLAPIQRMWYQRAPGWLQTLFSVGRIVSGFRGLGHIRKFLWAIISGVVITVMAFVWEWWLAWPLVLQLGFMASVLLGAVGVVGHLSVLLRGLRSWFGARDDPLRLFLVEPSVSVMVSVKNQHETADVIVEITAIRGSYSGVSRLPIRLKWQTSGSDIVRLPKGKSAVVTVGEASFHKQDAREPGDYYYIAVFTAKTPDGDKKITQWTKFGTPDHGIGHLWEIEVTATRVEDGTSASMRLGSCYRMYEDGFKSWSTNKGSPHFDLHEIEANAWGRSREPGEWATE